MAYTATNIHLPVSIFLFLPFIWQVRPDFATPALLCWQQCTADILNRASEIHVCRHTVQISAYGSKHHRRPAGNLRCGAVTSHQPTCSMELWDVQAIHSCIYFILKTPTCQHIASTGITFIDHNLNEDRSCDTFAKLRQACISFTSVHVCPSAWNIRLRLDGFPWNLIFQLFFENLSRKFKFHQKSKRITDSVHECVFTFMKTSRWILLRMRNVSNKSCRETPNTLFMFCNFFLQKIVLFMR